MRDGPQDRLAARYVAFKPMKARKPLPKGFEPMKVRAKAKRPYAGKQFSA